MVGKQPNKEEEKKGFKSSKPCQFGQSCKYKLKGECKFSHEGDDQNQLTAGKLAALDQNGPPKSTTSDKASDASGDRKKGKDRPMCHQNLTCGNRECYYKHSTPNKKSPAAQIEAPSTIPD